MESLIKTYEERLTAQAYQELCGGAPRIPEPAQPCQSASCMQCSPVHLQQDSQTVAMQPPDHNNMPVQVITALIIHLTVVILHTLHLPALIPMFLLHHHI